MEQQNQQRPRISVPKNCLPLLGNGKFDVGYADIMVSAKDERNSECDGGIFARIFYPTSHNREKMSTTDEIITLKNGKLHYLRWRPESEYMEGLAMYRGMSSRKMNFFLDWVLGDKKIPALWHTPLAASTERFPIAIFSHGISGNRLFYTTFCSSLASCGYVVAALEHRDGSSCWTYELERDSNGNLVKKDISMRKLPHDEQEYEIRITQVRKRVFEILRMLKLLEQLDGGLFSKDELLIGNEFAWEQFSGKLDFTNTVSIGHSFGGASALTACAVHKNFKSCVLLDGWLYPFERKYYTEVTQPVLMICSSKWQWPKNMKRLLHLQKQADGTGKRIFTFQDIVHQSFSDFGFLAPGYVGRYFGLQGLLHPEFTGKTIMEFIINFLQDTAGSTNLLHEITSKYKFIQEGTDIPMEKLDAIDDDLVGTISVEAGEEEENKICREGEVDAFEAQ